MLRYGLIALIVVVIVAAAVVRLRPLSPKKHHIDVEALIAKGGRGQFSRLVIVQGDPLLVAAKMKAIIEATPRTALLAGTLSVEKPQLITRASYVTRSAIWGFPDVTAVKIEASNVGMLVSLHGRLIYGVDDFGVNEARINSWFAKADAP